MRRAVSPVLATLAAMVAGMPASAAVTEIPCAETALQIRVPNAKCAKVDSEGPAFTWFNVYSDQYISQTRLTDVSYYIAESGSAFAKSIRSFNGVTTQATDWTPVVQHRNAWITSFTSNNRRCVGFSNYGPPKDFGYAWTSTGFACDPNPVNVGRPFGPADFDLALDLVKP